MKLMVRLTDGWNHWDVVVNVQHDPLGEGETFMWDEATYEAARYLPKDVIISYSEMERYLTEQGYGPFKNFEEMLDEALYQENVVWVDYLKGFVQLWPVDSRVMPPNVKLGPVSNEMPATNRYVPQGPARRG